MALWASVCSSLLWGSIYQQLLCSFNATTIKIPVGFFVEVDKLILKFLWKSKGSRIVKAILQKKEQRWRSQRYQTTAIPIYSSSIRIDKEISGWSNTLPSLIQSTDFQQRCQNHSIRKRKSFQWIILQQPDNNLEKSESQSLPHIKYKNSFYMDHRHNCTS